jgi:hypothetical protein
MVHLVGVGTDQTMSQTDVCPVSVGYVEAADHKRKGTLLAITVFNSRDIVNWHVY